MLKEKIDSKPPQPPQYDDEVDEKLPRYEKETIKPPKSKGLPTLEELVTHLKFLKALGILKELAIAQMSIEEDKKWPCYLTIAARRFIIFISALRSKAKALADFDSFLDEINPPLDVLMVWHSLLLNPKTSLHELKAANFTQFSSYPFPLAKIAGFIGDKDFLYRPDSSGVAKFNSLVNEYLESIGTKESFKPSAYSNFEPESCRWKVYCPCCFQVVDDGAPLYLEEGRAFSDPDYVAPLDRTCSCSSHISVDHNRLRYRQLLRDAVSEESSFTESYDPSMTIMYNTRNTNFGVNLKIEIATQLRALQNNDQDTGIHNAVTNINKKYLVFTREYYMFNLIHCTLPQGSIIQIHEDLVAACLRQERFWTKMNELNWYKNVYRDMTVGESISRYSKFISLIKTTPGTVVPTLDIDLAWHTHQLSQENYFDYCLKEVGKLVDHDDKFEETKLSEAFEKTCKLYKKTFKVDYSICHCPYCTTNRMSSRSFFRRPKDFQPHLVLAPDFSASHISTHNSVTVGTKKAQAMHPKLTRKYNARTFNKISWYEREKNAQATAVPYISIGMLDPSGKAYSTGCEHGLSHCGGAGSHSSDPSDRLGGSGCGGFTCGTVLCGIGQPIEVTYKSHPDPSDDES